MIGMLEIMIISLIVLILLSAFFSGTETALMSIGMARSRSLVKQKKKGAEALMRLKKNPRRLLITILIGNNLVNILAASIATILFTEMFGSNGIGIATGIMTLLILVFGEITPKSFATLNSEKMSLAVARPIEVLSYILYPIVKFLEILTSLMMKLFGSKKEKMLTEEELKTVVTMGHEEGILSKEVADMMDSLVEFGEKDVDEIMTLKDEIAFVDGNLKLKDVVDYIVKTPFSRYPVYVKTKDNIVGILDVDDVLKYIKENKLNVKVKNIAREVYFVPETKDIDDLLVEFQRKETPMAMVVDEYGSVVGMVTMEDILEEIVGDIFDKSMRREFYITHVNKNTIRADARARIDQIERTLGIELKEGDFNTVAGLIEHKLGRIPKKGEKIDLGKFYIIVEKTTRKRIEKVKIVKK